MPGVRDSNLRSGDLHEELGLFLLRSVALVAPVPRPEDVGNDAFATLVRPESRRRLIPDLSFVVQLKAASIDTVSFVKPDELNWVINLEIPLFIGRVDLADASIVLYSTARLHQILMEQSYDEIHLLINSGDESSAPKTRRANLGPPVHRWTVADVTQADFRANAFAVLRPHVESLGRNRQLRQFKYHESLKWQTGKPPTPNGIMMMGSAKDEPASTALSAMVPNIQRLLLDLAFKKRYADFPIIFEFVQMMRRWGVDPDPHGTNLKMAAFQADGPEITQEDIIRLRYLARARKLDLSRLNLDDESLSAIPDDVQQLALCGTFVTDDAMVHLQRLKGLSRLNVSGTNLTDKSLDVLSQLPNLAWLNVEHTDVTAAGIRRLKEQLPDLEVVQSH